MNLAAATAAAAYKYTYTLSRSLYVPLTSRCNSVPLPVTRGPGFALPRPVAESLVGMRLADRAPPPGRGAAVLPDRYRDYDEEDDSSRVHFPPYDLPLVNCLYHGQDDVDGVGDLPGHLRRRRQIIADASAGGGGGVVADDGLRPSISTLIEEVRSRLDLIQPAIAADGAGGGGVAGGFDQVVIAGEGEPTLRMDALLASHAPFDRIVVVGSTVTAMTTTTTPPATAAMAPPPRRADRRHRPPEAAAYDDGRDSWR
jgi:hypothetical protein